MENSHTSIPLSDLLCREEEEDCFNGYYPFFVSKDEDDYIQKWIARELESDSDCYTIKHTWWFKSARLNAIDWFFNTRAVFGFHLPTAYLSVTYLDRFISKRSIDDGKLWAISLLSVACLSLAAKMEECKLPALSEYPMNYYRFENKVIQRMELLVLNTLEWKMSTITPFAYLEYFSSKFSDESSPKEVASSRAVELIVNITKEISLMDYRPSIIAAAAVLAVSNPQLTRKAVEDKFSMISSWGSLQNEQIFACYNLMTEIEMRKVKTPKSAVLLAHSSTIYSSKTDCCLISVAGGTKRKLSWEDSDQNLMGSKKASNQNGSV